MKIIKKSVPYLNPIITPLFNLSLSTGTFPNKLKMARVTTIHKGGSFIDQTNFRPISILNAFSKILETLMYNRVNEFCNAHNILSEYQFSFLQKRSTESALQCFTNDVLSSFDNNEIYVVYF